MALIFSIIIPTFNRAKIICSAIDSVLDQNYNNCEIKHEISKKLNFHNKFEKLKKGDSLNIDNNEIKIYKNEKIIEIIKKKYKFDGVYIKFN